MVSDRIDAAGVVDDMQLQVVGRRAEAKRVVRGAAVCLYHALVEAKLVVNTKKLVVVSSDLEVARQLTLEVPFLKKALQHSTRNLGGTHGTCRTRGTA